MTFKREIRQRRPWNSWSYWRLWWSALLHSKLAARRGMGIESSMDFPQDTENSLGKSPFDLATIQCANNIFAEVSWLSQVCASFKIQMMVIVCNCVINLKWLMLYVIAWPHELPFCEILFMIDYLKIWRSHHYAMLKSVCAFHPAMVSVSDLSIS